MKKDRLAIMAKATAKRARRSAGAKEASPKREQGIVGVVKNLAQSAVDQTRKLVGG